MPNYSSIDPTDACSKRKRLVSGNAVSDFAPRRRCRVPVGRCQRNNFEGDILAFHGRNMTITATQPSSASHQYRRRTHRRNNG